MSTNPFLHIRGAKFPILEGEEEELMNDGIYGKALAQYLQKQFKQVGFDCPDVWCEDWGWWVELTGPPKMGLCVYGFPLADESLDLCIRVSPIAGRRWSWRRFRFEDTTFPVAQVYECLKRIVESDPEIESYGFVDDFPL